MKTRFVLLALLLVFAMSLTVHAADVPPANDYPPLDCDIWPEACGGGGGGGTGGGCKACEILVIDCGPGQPPQYLPTCMPKTTPGQGYSDCVEYAGGCQNGRPTCWIIST